MSFFKKNSILTWPLYHPGKYTPLTLFEKPLWFYSFGLSFI